MIEYIYTTEKVIDTSKIIGVSPMAGPSEGLMEFRLKIKEYVNSFHIDDVIFLHHAYILINREIKTEIISDIGNIIANRKYISKEKISKILNEEFTITE
ncbi:MAG: hypothetical protein COA52_00400 [Hyphomicrobiales bacterium]|nr:MAG: hypothetical protein COA52_00400 [Hyphomicrobiales bacterium]